MVNILDLVFSLGRLNVFLTNIDDLKKKYIEAEKEKEKNELSQEINNFLDSVRNAVNANLNFAVEEIKNFIVENEVNIENENPVNIYISILKENAERISTEIFIFLLDKQKILLDFNDFLEASEKIKNTKNSINNFIKE